MKKLFSLISVLAVAGLGVGLLAACSEKEEEVPSDDTTTPEPEHTHSYTGVVTTPATCTEDGLMTYTCECGDSYTEPIPATGHSWSAWSADTTVEEEVEVDLGTHSRVCSVCDASETEPHVWTAVYVLDEDDPVNTLDGAGGNTGDTGTASGHYEWDCEVCGAHGEGSSLADIPSSEEGEGVDVTIEVSDASNLSDVLVNGATVVLAPELGENEEDPDAVPTVELDSTLSVGAGVSATVVVSDGTALVYNTDDTATASALISVGGEDGNGASLTLELGEGATISGNAYGNSNTGTSGSAERYGGLLEVQKGGELVINGDGTVMQEDSNAAVLVIDVGGVCTINGGSYMVDNGENYTVINDGTLTINDGFFGTTNPKSSLIINGNNNASDGHQADEKPELYINGGTFVGGKHVVKNALAGVCEIAGGYFDGFLLEESNETSSQDIIDCDGGIIRISGGVFGMTEETETKGSFVHTLQVIAGTADVPSVIDISGGTFYKGSEGFITYGGSSGGNSYAATIYDRVVLTPEMFVTLSDILGVTEGTASESYSITEQLDEDGVTVIGYEVLDANASDPTDTGDTGNDEP